MTKEQKYPEAVGAFIVARDKPDLFLGVGHNASKRVSGRIGNSLQVSLLTETLEGDEDHRSALDRLLKIEELYVEGVSDQPELPLIRLCTSMISTDSTNARLDTYLFTTETNAKIEIIDGEISEVGWVNISTVLSAPEKAWWIRPTLYETIMAYKGRLDVNSPWRDLRHPARSDIYYLLEAGLSENLALYQLGLLGRNQSRPWDFVRSLSKPQNPLIAI